MRRCGQTGHSCFPSCFWSANMLDWPAPPSRLGDAVKWNIVVFSVVFWVQICSIGPHLPAPFWCGRVFGQCEEGGDHLFRRFLSETIEMLNRIPSAGALCDVRCPPPGAYDAAHFFSHKPTTNKPTTNPSTGANVASANKHGQTFQFAHCIWSRLS